MSRKRQAKKRKASKKRNANKRSYAVSGDLFREASGILMDWVKDQINEMANERLYTVRNRGGSGAELARETLISRDPGLAMELRDDTIREAVKSYFRGERAYGEIESWDVSNVTNMRAMFQCSREFNPDLSAWDVSNVANMSSMFQCCGKFNSDISRWDVSNVRNMSYMFAYCCEFDSDLSKWDVSRVRNMIGMFYLCHEFNSDLSTWDVSNVKDERRIFQDCFTMIATNKPNFM